jgi:hypothetical protein
MYYAVLLLDSLLFYFNAVLIHIRVSRRSCAYARDTKNKQLQLPFVYSCIYSDIKL